MNGRLEADLLAVTREEAVAVLERAGVRVETQLTGKADWPPGLGAAERVVRVHLYNDIAVITVACEMSGQPGDRKYIPARCPVK